MAERLRTAIHKERPQLDKPKPDSTWELFADPRLTQSEEDLKTIRNRIDTLIWSVIGTIVLAAVSMIVRNL